MLKIPLRSTLFALIATYGVASLGQGVVGSPSGWSTITHDGVTVLSPTGLANVTVTLSRLPADTDLRSWLQSAEPNLQIDQQSTNSDAAGSAVTTLLAENPATGATTVIFATRAVDGLLVSALRAPDALSASHQMRSFTKMVGAWNGLKTSTSRSLGGSATATADSSGGGSNKVSSNSYTSPDGHFSSSSSSASASASSQNSQSSSQSKRDSKTSSQSNHDSQSNSNSMSDRDSKSNGQRNSGSQSNSNSQSNKNNSSQSSSQSKHQIVYDPGTRKFDLLVGPPKSGGLIGDYRYASDLLAAPLGSGFLPATMTAVAHFNNGTILLGDLAGHLANGRFQVDGDTLEIAYDYGDREDRRIRILESVDGVATKFAIGPCVYVQIGG